MFFLQNTGLGTDILFIKHADIKYGSREGTYQKMDIWPHWVAMEAILNNDLKVHRPSNRDVYFFDMFKDICG